VSAASLGLHRCAVHTEGQASSTCLASITFTLHITQALIDGRAATQSITTEALSPILSTSHAVPLRVTISCALGIGDLMVTNVRECDAVEDAVA